MNLQLDTFFRFFIGWFMVLVGLILMPMPILPGTIFFLMGGVLLGWISKRRLKRLKCEMKKALKLVKKN